MAEIMLKRGYSVTVERERDNIDPKVDIIGNYSKSGYMATVIVNKYGIAPTVRENHGQVTAIIEEEQMNTYEENVKAYRERYDYIIDAYVCDDFTEITGSIGGDVERVRIYKDGSVGVK